jgi:hypothetical protein
MQPLEATMFKSRSSGEKPREGKVKRAKATVLTADYNPSPWQGSGGGPSWALHHYTLRVEPEDEGPFEANIAFRGGGARR